MTQLYALPDQRDVILTSDAVLEGGRELSSDEIGLLADQLNQARLETLWREVLISYPLGGWVLGPGGVHGMVITHHRAMSGAEDHALSVRSLAGAVCKVPVDQARQGKPPEGAACASCNWRSH